MTAERDQLHFSLNLVEPLHDVHHDARAMSTKQNNPGRAIGSEAQTLSFRNAVQPGLLVELRFQHHARGLKCVRGGMAHGQGLLFRPFASDDDVLGFALDPEVGRIVR